MNTELKKLLADLQKAFRSREILNSLDFLAVLIIATLAVRLCRPDDNRLSAQFSLTIFAGLLFSMLCLNILRLAICTPWRMVMTRISARREGLPYNSKEMAREVYWMMLGLAISIATVMLAIHLSPISYAAVTRDLVEKARIEIKKELGAKAGLDLSDSSSAGKKN